MTPQFRNVNHHSISNDTLDFILKHPQMLSELCYELRVMISSSPNDLVPKSFFANMLGCEIKELAQIESGHIYNFPLAYRYYFKLITVYKLFN